MKLRLWIEARGSNDADLFVAIEKFDSAGERVPFTFMSEYDIGPVALGWLRVSHRELDKAKSTAYQPYHEHKREIKLKPGQIVVINNHEFNVAEDEEGKGVTIQLIQSLKNIESLAESKAKDSGLDLRSLDDRARTDWMWQFLNELKDNLQKWQEIKTISGPGDNLTFTKFVYKWSYSDWK